MFQRNEKVIFYLTVFLNSRFDIQDVCVYTVSPLNIDYKTLILLQMIQHFEKKRSSNTFKRNKIVWKKEAIKAFKTDHHLHS